MVDQDDFSTRIDGNLPDLLGLATADKIFGIRSITLAGDGSAHGDAGRLGQLGELVEIFLLDRCAET